MKLGLNSVAVLVAAGVISSTASADSASVAAAFVNIDQKAASNIQSILSNSAFSESQKVFQIGAVMKKVNFAKEFQKMRLNESDVSLKSVGQRMTCGDYNL